MIENSVGPEMRIATPATMTITRRRPTTATARRPRRAKLDVRR
jgi:hypothetical protein